MIPLYETFLMIIAAFLILGFFLYDRWRRSRTDHVITQKALLFLSLFCFILAAVGIMAVLLYSIDPEPPCEWLLENQTSYFKYGDNYSGYHWDYLNDPPSCSNPNDFSCVRLFHEHIDYVYVNSCDTEDFGIVEALYMMLIAVFGMLLLVLIIVCAFHFIKVVKKVFEKW